MDLAHVLKELWLRRGWVALGVLIALYAGLATGYHVSLLPPSIEKKALSIGAADTQILVDTPTSALTDLGIELDPLANRASVYARFMTSRPVREAIAREVGVDSSQIVAEAPLSQNTPLSMQEPSSADRNNGLLGENNVFRLRFSSDSGLPVVTIQSQAPRVEDAIRLADAAAVAFQKYVSAVQRRQDVPAGRRVEIRQLGNAQGGLVAADVNVALAGVTFVGVLIGWCLLILLFVAVARALREGSDNGDRALDGLS